MWLQLWVSAMAQPWMFKMHNYLPKMHIKTHNFQNAKSKWFTSTIFKKWIIIAYVFQPYQLCAWFLHKLFTLESLQPCAKKDWHSRRPKMNSLLNCHACDGIRNEDLLILSMEEILHRLEIFNNFEKHWRKMKKP